MGYSIRQDAQERTNALKAKEVDLIEIMADLKVRIRLVEQMVDIEEGYEKRSSEKALADMVQQMEDLKELLQENRQEQKDIEADPYKGDRLVLPTTPIYKVQKVGEWK